MKDHRKQLSKHTLTATGQALFALAAAERLRGCCWCFEKEFESSMEPFFRWCSVLFDQVFSGAALSREQLRAASKEVQIIIPNSDDYGSSLAVQAQSGALCLLSALLVLVGDEKDVVVGVANSVADALDNFAYFVGNQISESDDAPGTCELLQREMARQLYDARTITDLMRRGVGALTEWRIENRQFTVPSAI